MTPAVECRAAALDDLDAVARLWHESARKADGASSEMPALGTLRGRIDAELADSWTLTVATIEGRIIGMLAIKRAVGVLDKLFVLPSAKRMGVGSLLLQEAMNAMPAGFTLRIASANAGARRFYEHMGLMLTSEGRHPRHGYPVCFYEWKLG